MCTLGLSSAVHYASIPAQTFSGCEDVENDAFSSALADTRGHQSTVPSANTALRIPVRRVATIKFKIVHSARAKPESGLWTKDKVQGRVKGGGGA